MQYYRDLCLQEKKNRFANVLVKIKNLNMMYICADI